MTQSAVFLKALDLCEAQARLDALPGSLNNLFDNMIWHFKNQKDDPITIDFNDLTDMNKKYPNWPLVHTVDWIVLTKLI
jgi:hypothetical protein